MFESFKNLFKPKSTPTYSDEPEELVFPPAVSLKDETLEKVPFITEDEILKRIKVAQSNNTHYIYIYNYRIDEEMVKRLKRQGFRVEICDSVVGFRIEWY